VIEAATPGLPGARIVRWMLWPGATGLPTIVLVVDDAGDRELVAAVALTDNDPGRRVSGQWGTGQHGCRRLVGFRLFTSGDGFELLLITHDVHRELLEAILDVPHWVALVAQGVAGDATTAAAIAPRLGDGLIVRVEQRSAHVARLLAPRGMN